MTAIKENDAYASFYLYKGKVAHNLPKTGFNCILYDLENPIGKKVQYLWKLKK